ncbi:MAG: CRISPR-associated protein Cas5 [Spirochaetes bacterium]|nr:CRISPR-associated protein Cas5 [Spirochaetota bacterium]
MNLAIVFDIKGQYALFKKPYSPLSPVSYPIPPPTAIFGIVGAIIGLSKNSQSSDYYLRKMNEGEARIGIKLLSPVKRYRAGLNWLITKQTHYFRPRGSHRPQKTEERPKEDAVRTQIPCEFIVDPGYRIYFSHSSEKIMESLWHRLSITRSTDFTICLGIASCIAEIDFIQNAPFRCRIEEIHEKTIINTSCVMPVSRAKVRFYQGNRLFRFRVPGIMAPDRTVTHYEDVIVNEEALPVEIEVESFEKIGEESLLLMNLKS